MKFSTAFVFFVFILVAAFWIWYLFFNIFEIRFVALPENGVVHKGGEIEFTAMPINALGKKAVWRTVDFNVEILQGKNLVRELSQSEKKFSVVGEKGNIVFRVSSPFAFAPSDFEFEIKK